MEFNAELISRLNKFLTRLIEMGGYECFTLKYHEDKKFVDQLLCTQVMRDMLRQKGFAFQYDKISKFIFYDDSLPIDEQIDVFLHEAAHCLLGHVWPPCSSEERKPITPEQNAQEEWEANFFSAAFMFLIQGALPIMEHYEALKEGATA